MKKYRAYVPGWSKLVSAPSLEDAQNAAEWDFDLACEVDSSLLEVHVERVK
jgi:hypothetical protein